MAIPVPSRCLLLPLTMLSATAPHSISPPAPRVLTPPACAPNLESSVLKSGSFLELRWPLVLALVREGELQVDEVDLFKAVQAWLSRNPSDRRRYIDEVRSSSGAPLHKYCLICCTTCCYRVSASSGISGAFTEGFAVRFLLYLARCCTVPYLTLLHVSSISRSVR